VGVVVTLPADVDAIVVVVVVVVVEAPEMDVLTVC
jgi:hypothetical protein